MDDLEAKLIAADDALDAGDLVQAEALLVAVESTLQTAVASPGLRSVRANLGALMIDLGAWTHSQSLLERGTRHADEARAQAPTANRRAIELYNVANGYSSLADIRAPQTWQVGTVTEEHLKAKQYYREALDLVGSDPTSVTQYDRVQLLVNYANRLDAVGRQVEAIRYYDEALALDSTKGEALGNKGMAIARMAPLAQGQTHAFWLEAHRLLGEALQSGVSKRHKEVFGRYQERVEAVMHQHGAMKPERPKASRPSSDFHVFLQDFCTMHELYLTPATCVGRGRLVRGDPMFISHMVAPLEDDAKFDRYVTFLNQIKQDYLLARYCLCQSQFRSPSIGVIDASATLYYPLDYSLDGAYIQLLKASLKMAMDVLDKVAFFVHDYCHVTSIGDTRVSFRNVWADDKQPRQLRTELRGFRSLYLRALFDLGLDFARGGYFAPLCERRHSLTHRFLVVHDMLLEGQVNADLPRVTLPQFRNECIQAMQLARAAIMYLILFVDSEEKSASQGDGRSLPILPTPLDYALLWKPSGGRGRR